MAVRRRRPASTPTMPGEADALTAAAVLFARSARERLASPDRRAGDSRALAGPNPWVAIMDDHAAVLDRVRAAYAAVDRLDDLERGAAIIRARLDLDEAERRLNVGPPAKRRP